MSTNINTVEEREQWSLMKDQAQVLIQSGALPAAVRNAPQAIAIIQYGRELGYPPMTALQNISLIQGKPTLSANLIGSRLKQFGYDFRIEKYEDDEVKIRFIYKNGDEVSISYTMEEAKQAGNTSKQNYAKYSKEMLYARCLTRGGRIVAPEALAGIYSPEEMSEPSEKSEPEKPSPRVIDVESEESKAEDAEVTEIVSEKPEVNDALKFTKEVAKSKEDIVLDSLEASKSKETFKKLNSENIEIIKSLTGERKARYDKVVQKKAEEWSSNEKGEVDNSKQIEAAFKEDKSEDEGNIEPNLKEVLENATASLKGVKDKGEYYRLKSRFNFDKSLKLVKDHEQIQTLFKQLDAKYPASTEEPKIEETTPQVKIEKEEDKPKGKVRRI